MNNFKKVSVWQTGILLFVLMFANKILILPSLLYNDAKSEAIWIPIFVFVLDFLLVVLFCKLKNRFPTQSFHQIVEEKCGKWCKGVLFFCLVVFFLSKIVLLYNITYVFFKELIYKDSDNFLFLICFLPVVNHLALSSEKVLGRTVQFFFPMIVLLTIFCLVVGIFGINSSFMLFQASPFQFVGGVLKHLAAFGDSAFLFVFMDKIEMKPKQNKILYWFALVSMFFVEAVVVIFILSYTYTSFMHPFALFEIVAFVKEYVGVGRIDIVSMLLVVIFTYLHLGIYLKLCFMCFEILRPKAKVFEPILIFNGTFLILSGVLMKNLSKSIFYGEKVLPFFCVLPFVVVPIVVFVVFWKSRGKHE